MRDLLRLTRLSAGRVRNGQLRDRLAVHRGTVAALPDELPMAGESWGLSFGPDTGAGLERWRRDVLPALDDKTAVSVAVILVHALVVRRGWWTATTLLPVLSRRRLPWDRDDVALLFSLAAQAEKYGHIDALKAAANAAQVLEPADRSTLAHEIQQALARVEAEDFSTSERARLRAKLRALVPPVNDRTTMSRVDTRAIHRGDGWSAFAIGRLESVAEDAYHVTELLNHAAVAMSGPRPTKAWEKQAADLISGLPMAPTLVRELLEGVLSCRPALTRAYGLDLHLRVGPDNADLVRGLLWAAAILDEDWLVPVVSAIAADRMPGDSKLANASFAVLGRSGRVDAIAALTQLKRATRDRGSLKQIARSLDEAAAAAGMNRSALLERAVPEADLGPDGVRRMVIGDATAILTLDPAARVQLEWEHGGHRTSRVPADIAAEHGSQVSALKRDATELRQLVSAERDRLEDLLIEGRNWPLEEWRAIYLGHPVTRPLAARLLWRIEDGDLSYTAMPEDGQRFTREDGSRVVPGAGVRVRPWHPVHADPADVRAWRAFLVEHEIVQPFKQAFREVYLLTPAEEQTRLYSNRFAAHILRYQQTYALMKERRWATNYLGPWDGGYNGEAKRDFDSHRLRAVFFHEPVDSDVNADRVSYCSTDQVRFVRLGDRSGEPVPLVDVPPIVLSEAMRDVDLFVGVTSIAADPSWADRGEDRYFAYWERTAFGELTATGQTRRDVLERLLPRLKIRDRCRIAGNYLIVEGRKHLYRIHLGSANILMSPNDQYLCIVPARAATPPGVRFVPFDGDDILSVILAKALMLADDHKIIDPSIRRQIG